ncbi:ABC transporter ATP-binding protein, partial [Pseudomonas sp. 2822-15]
GNYSYYLEEKAKRLELEMKKFEKQQDEIKKLEDFVQRNIARASTSNRAKSRRKQLEKINVMNRPMDEDASANFRFEIMKQSGNDVLSIDNLKLGYDDKPLIENVSLKLNR